MGRYGGPCHRADAAKKGAPSRARVRGSHHAARTGGTTRRRDGGGRQKQQRTILIIGSGHRKRSARVGDAAREGVGRPGETKRFARRGLAGVLLCKAKSGR